MHGISLGARQAKFLRSEELVSLGGSDLAQCNADNEYLHEIYTQCEAEKTAAQEKCMQRAPDKKGQEDSQTQCEIATSEMAETMAEMTAECETEKSLLRDLSAECKIEKGDLEATHTDAVA